jgi:hypothetical protein
MIEDCETRESRLSPWEVSFIDSLKKMLEKGVPPQHEADRRAGRHLGKGY